MEAIRAEGDLRVVLSLREEFLVAIQRLAIELERYWVLFPLEKLRLASAKEAIESPAKAGGIDYDGEVVSDLVNELAQVRYVDHRKRTVQERGDFIEPLHLQIVCHALWRFLPPKIRRITWLDIEQAIPRSGYDLESPVERSEAIGAFVQSALAGFCTNVIADVASEQAFPIEMIELGCQQFISESQTRQRAYRQTDHVGSLPNTIVEALAHKHLLRVEDRNGVPWFELAHDTLIEPVRARTQRADFLALQQLWLRLIRQIMIESLAGDGVDEMQLVNRLSYCFVSGAGDASRASAKVVEAEIGGGALELLCQSGLIRRVSDQQSNLLELSHPHLARALFQIQSSSGRDPGPLYNWARIVFSSVSSTIVAVLFVMTSRSLLQWLHLTLTQGSGDGFVNGWFQGVIGAIDWSLFIAGALSSWWFLVEHLKMRPSGKQMLQAAALGGVAGLVGGLVVTANLLYAQSANSLYEAGWILDQNRPRLSAFSETGFAWGMLLFGLGLGLASGASMVSALRSSRWKRLVARYDERSLAETIRAIGPVFLHVLICSWYIVAPIMLAAAFISNMILVALSNPPTLARVLGECLVISLGSEGIVSGLIFGIFALRTGFAIPAPEGR